MNNRIDTRADRSLQDEISQLMFENIFKLGYVVFCTYKNSFLLEIPGTTKRAILDFSDGKFSLELHDVNGIDKDEVFDLREEFYTSLTSAINRDRQFNRKHRYIEVIPVIN